jgi:Carboxypeptidase regulatory-like domain
LTPATRRQRRGQLGLRLAAALLLVALVAPTARAQTLPALSGIVQDPASSRAIIGALVTLSTATDVRSTRTDETGSFLFAKLPPGTYQLSVRRLGYDPSSQTVSIAGDTRVTVSLTRLATLDTVRVRAAAQGIYGVVARAHDLQPLPNATVQIFGTSVGQISTDSAGRFFYSVQTPGPYLVRGKAPGLAGQTVSVTVQPHDGVEVALLLDSAEADVPGIEMAFADFRSRLMRRRNGSAVVPRTELLTLGNGGVVSSLVRAQSFSAKSLRFTDVACVFVDGAPRPGLSANAVAAEDVEAVEVYTGDAERSGTLAERWPKNVPCGNTGAPHATERKITPGGRDAPSDIVRWIVIWLKH